jgi:cation:H+ antiporter
MDYLFLVFGLCLIFLAAELFTNAIEWFGKHFKLGDAAVGSILAAVGTALPETSVALVAIIMGGQANEDAGIGAVLGAPMMLSTLAMFITGLAVLVFASRKRRSKLISADYTIVGRDLRTFFGVYLLALAGAFLPNKPLKIALAVILIGMYCLYVKKSFACGLISPDQEDTKPLHFKRNQLIPHFRWIVVQLLSGLALMIFGAHEFISSVTVISASLGISPLVLSLIITPIATELPEKFNSVTWIRGRKDTLALGNITGAMVFQSSILPAVGMIFTPWVLNLDAKISIAIALLATFIIWLEMTLKKRINPYSLLIGGLIYLLYPICVFWLFKAH